MSRREAAQPPYPMPWRIERDGPDIARLVDGDGHSFLTLTAASETPADLARHNATVLLLAAAPQLLHAAGAVWDVRPVNWCHDEDPEQALAWLRLLVARSAAGVPLRAAEIFPGPDTEPGLPGSAAEQRRRDRPASGAADESGHSKGATDARGDHQVSDA